MSIAPCLPGTAPDPVCLGHGTPHRKRLCTLAARKAAATVLLDRPSQETAPDKAQQNARPVALPSLLRPDEDDEEVLSVPDVQDAPDAVRCAAGGANWLAPRADCVVLLQQEATLAYLQAHAGLSAAEAATAARAALVYKHRW